MTTKCNYDCNENGLSLNYFSFSLQSLLQDGVEINARPFPVLVILFVIRIKHHHLSISWILRRMGREGWPYWAPANSLCSGGLLCGWHGEQGRFAVAQSTHPISPFCSPDQDSQPHSLQLQNGDNSTVLLPRAATALHKEMAYEGLCKL